MIYDDDDDDRYSIFHIPSFSQIKTTEVGAEVVDPNDTFIVITNEFIRNPPVV